MVDIFILGFALFAGVVLFDYFVLSKKKDGSSVEEEWEFEEKRSK